MDLDTFDRQLRQELGTDPTLRPFVCDGSPLDCDAFIVGSNPATEVDFWTYWDVRKGGFRYQAWRAAYEAGRRARSKPPESNTRRRIDLIVRAAHPVRSLETNVYATPTARESELSRVGSRSVLAFLVDAIRPRVIFAHGRVAIEAVSELSTDAALVESRHLAYVGYEAAIDLGRRVRQAANMARENG